MGQPWSNQAVSLIILTEQTTGFSGLFGYSPTVGPGNLIFSVAAVAGVDPYGNSYPQGISSTVGQLTTTGITTSALTVTEGPFLFYGSSNGGQVTFTAGQSGNWTVPANVTMVTSTLTGGGGNGAQQSSNGNLGGGGGGGGECAVQTFTVTPASLLAYSVGNAAQNTTFNGITAHAGGNAPSGSLAGGAGGTGSTATVHYNGGAGGAGQNDFGFPGGGGSSAGPTQAGNAGSPTDGGAAVPGGGSGGSGGTENPADDAGGTPGGGGGGDYNGFTPGAGGGGQLILTYASTPSPTDLLLAIASAAGSDGLGNTWGTGLTLAPVTAPATPTAGCILYYNSGGLYAVGPSNTPVLLATT